MGGRHRVVVVVVVGEGRHFAAGGSRWLGWEAVGNKESSEGRVVIVVVVAGSHETHTSALRSSNS